MPEFHPEGQPAVPLYHYTTQKGFLGIIDTKCIFATNLYYMSDAMEMKHAVSVACNAFDKFSNDKDRLLAGCAVFCKNKLEALEEFPIYACCFSEERDLLSQWRGYAGECGLSLCFDPSKLSEVSVSNNFRLRKCIYDLDEQYLIASNAVQNCLNVFQQRNPESDPIKSCIKAFDVFVDDYYNWGPLFKHESFREEKEWRLLSAIQSYRSANVKFRAGKHCIIPYAAVKLDIEYSKGQSDGRTQLGFYDILIGPTPIKELPWKAVMQLCEAKNIYFTQITPTSIPYRAV